jgi:hypothetical protein
MIVANRHQGSHTGRQPLVKPNGSESEVNLPKTCPETLCRVGTKSNVCHLDFKRLPTVARIRCSLGTEEGSRLNIALGIWEDRKGIGLTGCGDHEVRRTGRRYRRER